MIEDIDYLGREWGRRMRYQPHGYRRENHITRLLEKDFIGSGNSFKLRTVALDRFDTTDQPETLGRNLLSASKKNYEFYRSIIPIKFMSENQQRFHRAWGRLEECAQEMLWAHYVPKVDHKRILDLLKITGGKYDRRLDLSLKAVAHEIDCIDIEDLRNRDVEGLRNRKAARKQTSQKVVGPLWSCRIFSYVHKVPINDSHRNPFPICLSLTGHNNSRSPFVKRPIDSNMYCRRPDGELYATVPIEEGLRLSKQGQLNNYLADLRDGVPSDDATIATRRATRLLRKTGKGQWLVGKEGDLRHIRKLKGLENITTAIQSPGEDVLRAILGFDNDAFIPAPGSDFAFDQKAMRDFQSQDVQLQVKRLLSDIEDKIKMVADQGQTEIEKQYKQDLKDLKRLTRGKCISKTKCSRADGGDPFRRFGDMLHKRKDRALSVLRKAGLNREADDLDGCYKIEDRSAIFFPYESRFTWLIDQD